MIMKRIVLTSLFLFASTISMYAKWEIGFGGLLSFQPSDNNVISFVPKFQFRVTTRLTYPILLGAKFSYMANYESLMLETGLRIFPPSFRLKLDVRLGIGICWNPGKEMKDTVLGASGMLVYFFENAFFGLEYAFETGSLNSTPFNLHSAGFTTGFYF
ncbi:MAG: hypothetical protein HPY53_01265 [Brevinematales bacterium]|nr:hypothetical protein [Brevinematales bacterium]